MGGAGSSPRLRVPASPRLGWAAALLTAGAIGAAGWRKRALTLDGALAATAVGTLVQARGGLPAAGALVAFFVTSSALSRLKERQKSRRGVVAAAKGGQRDAWQVLANGGPATAWLVLRGRGGAGGYLGALATAGADTWATELGLLAGRRPRLLTTLRPVQPGSSGAVTPEGTLAAVAGAAAVGATWDVLRRLEGPSPAGPALLAATAAGVLGSLVDSLLGATLQASYWCDRCGEPAETPTHARCGQPTRRTGGWAWMTNDAVNALATAAGSVAGALLGRPGRHQ
jgi:uncharacterized protein (TIGR00297 family)